MKKMTSITNPKIRHVIGQFRDDPDYPLLEDIEYLVLKWYYMDGGYEFIHDNRGLEDDGSPIFDDKIILELLNSDQKATTKVLDELQSEKRISVCKQTAHTKYYRVDNLTHYYFES